MFYFTLLMMEKGEHSSCSFLAIAQNSNPRCLSKMEYKGGMLNWRKSGYQDQIGTEKYKLSHCQSSLKYQFGRFWNLLLSCLETAKLCKPTQRKCSLFVSIAVLLTSHKLVHVTAFALAPSLVYTRAFARPALAQVFFVPHA